MAGFQFIHTESYARKAGKGKAGGRNMVEIALEADRVIGNCPHVSRPKSPIIRYGLSALETVKLAEIWADQAKDYMGRKLRSDGLCLLAGVISYPKDGDNWEHFAQKSVDWLKEKYGDQLKSVVEHTDESNPHLHFYVVPRAGARFDSIHQGRKASFDADTANLPKGAQNKAYIEAMKAYQDEFSQAVAMSHGLTRLGPKKRRLTRKEWHLEQRQAQFFADAKAVHKATIKKAAAKGLEEGRAKAEIERDQAKRDAALLAESIGQAVGEFAKSLLSHWHKPTKIAEKQTKAAEESAEKIKAAHKKQEQRLKTEHTTAEATARKEIETLKRVNSNIEEDLKSAYKSIEQLNAELNYLRRNLSSAAPKYL